MRLINHRQTALAGLVAALVLGFAPSAIAATIEGTLYDSSTGEPVRGAALFLYYDAEDATPDELVAAGDLGAGQQGQVTSQNGRYRFDSTGSRRYRIAIDTSRGSHSFPSNQLPPRPGFAPAGSIVEAEEPAPLTLEGADRSYYLRFSPSLDEEFRNNHIPLDPLRENVSLTKRADKSQASTGDVVGYHIEVTNRTARDLTSSSSRAVYVLDAPPRGFSYVRGKAVATIRRGSETRVLSDGFEAFEGSTSKRLIRFGPFDLEAGETLTIEYQSVIGLDARPGRYANRAVLMDGGGVELSNEAIAEVRIVPDAALSSSVVLGRVFCDEDEDGRPGAKEPGVFGARVYLDSGVYAVTDSVGLFHFSRVSPGTHLVKLDASTLGSGRAIVESELLRLSEGLPAVSNFAVHCEDLWITPAHARGSIRRSGSKRPEDPARGGAPTKGKVIVSGDLKAHSLAVAGGSIDLPSAGLSVSIPAALRVPGSEGRGPNLRASAIAKNRLFVSFKTAHSPRSEGISPTKWSVRIASLDAAADLFRKDGRGVPPSEIKWADETLAPGLYAAQLTVYYANGDEASSARAIFGVDYGIGPAPPRQDVWRGPLFEGSAKKPTANTRLEAKLAELLKLLGSGDRILIEVHGDGRGDRIAALARTQRQAKLVTSLLTAGGVDAARVSARGRGSLEPLDRSGTPEALESNRRVIVTVESSARARESVPATVPGAADVLVEGESIAVREGRFRTVIKPPERGAVLIDMSSADGRRSAVEVKLRAVKEAAVKKAAAVKAPAPAPSARPLAVEGDLAALKISVGGEAVATALLSLDVDLVDQSSRRITDVKAIAEGDHHKAADALRFVPKFPPALKQGQWSLTIDDGQLSDRAVGRWAGAPEPVELVRPLQPGRTYNYWVTVTLPNGSVGASPKKSFLVEPLVEATEFIATGRLFGRDNRPRASLRNRLSRFVSKSKKAPAGQLYDFNLLVSVERIGSAVSKNLALASRSAGVRKYLKRLGLDPKRFTVAVGEAPAGQRDSLTVSRRQVAVTAPPKPAAEAASVRIDDTTIALEGSKFSGSMEVLPGERAFLAITLAGGQSARFAVEGVEEPAESTEPVETLPEPEADPDPDPESTRVGAVRAATLEVNLPPEGMVLSSSHLGLVGRTDPANRVSVNGRDVSVRRDGRFDALLELPAGTSTIVIRSTDRDGNTASIDWPVAVAERELFILALGEGILSSASTVNGWFGDDAYLSGMGADTTLASGAALLHGRARFYLKSRLSAGKLFPDVRLTAHMDTGRESGSGAFFEELIDPVRRDGVFGDSAHEVRDVNTRGKIYARIEAGESSAVLGSIHTSLEGGALFRYDRTLDGVLLDVDHKGKSSRTEVKGFSATQRADHLRDINWFRSTGGSLYYLRRNQVIEGSERLRVVIRDADSGMIKDERVLTRNVDYTIDYPGGRVLLIDPIPSVSGVGKVLENFENTATPLSGDPVYIEARYEHEDSGALEQRAAGIYARETIDGRLSMGAGAVVEGRGDASDYTLWGVDASYRLGKSSRVRAEIAGSREADANNMISADGGLSFLEFDHIARHRSEGRDDLQLGWRLGAELDGADLSGASCLKKTGVSLYAQKLDRGFSSGSTLPEQGRLKFGGMIRQALGARDELSLRHDANVAELAEVGPRLEDLGPDALALDDVATYKTALRWSGHRGRWRHSVEAAHQRISSTAALATGDPAIDARRFGVGALGQYQLSERLSLRAGQEVVTTTAEGDPRLSPILPGAVDRESDRSLAGVTSRIGVDLKLTPDTRMSSDYFQRWNGDNAAQIGLESALSESGSVYLRERISGDAGRAQTTTIVGAEDRGAMGGKVRTYGEYQLSNGVSGSRNRAVLGLGRRFSVAEGLRVGLGYEHQQTFGGFLPDGTPIGDLTRDLIRASADYTQAERYTLSAAAELRFDSADPGREDLLSSDPRVTGGAGTFPDHGGTAPYSPLFLPPGERIQLLGRFGATYRLTPLNTLFDRVRVAHTRRTDSGESMTEAEYVEGSAGWVHRARDDSFQMLSRYSYVWEQRPVVEPMSSSTDISHVVALAPVVRLPWRLVVSGKIAAKKTVRLQEDDREKTSVHALLALARLGYRLVGNWDLSAELRSLSLSKSEGRETRMGALFEAGYSVGKHARLGVGYNLSRFSDNELGELERDSHGFFVRVTGQY